MSDGLKMSNVSHEFGSNKVLNDVSFDVAPGELVCLLGPSGCGKTTALRLAAGLEKLQQGSVSNPKSAALAWCFRITPCFRI